MPDETLVTPSVGRSATKMRLQSARITVEVELVDDAGVTVRNTDFSVEVFERLPDGSFRWSLAVRQDLMDAVRKLARLLGLIPPAA